MQRIHFGISTCPNDTYAFHALMHGQIVVPGVEFVFELLDIEQLNLAILADRFDVAKASFHLAMLVDDRYQILKAGAALGFGVGPLLLAARNGTAPKANENSNQLTLCPGQYTTANLLFKIFYPQATKVEQAVFSDIMPRLRNHSADFGVCIHEGRFTWQDQGLALVEDLGQRWERETGLPLPLGGILAKNSLDYSVVTAVELGIQKSIEYARRHPEEALKTMRQYAQEFDDQVLMQHVDLYVNDWTLDLGDIGRRALTELKRRMNSV
jgi:1,4-dihydroxy-6-naphthoate synthase